MMFLPILLQMTFGEQNTEKEAHQMLSYAFEHGINTLDTAEAVSFYDFSINSLLENFFCVFLRRWHHFICTIFLPLA